MASARRAMATLVATSALAVVGSAVLATPALAAGAAPCSTVSNSIDHVDYTVTRADGSRTTATSSVVGYNLNALLSPGDTVTAAVFAKSGCSVTVSAASYRASFDSSGSPIVDTQTAAFSQATSTATATRPAVLTVTLPAASTAATCPNKHYGSDPGGGANGPGNYGSTCDGSASQNGNGGGSAKGRPCAGCVGNADDKNPPGQAPDGTDRNAGYECDRNSGVGRSNPAHTGCSSAGYQYDLVLGSVKTPPQYGSDVIATAFERF